MYILNLYYKGRSISSASSIVILYSVSIATPLELDIVILAFFGGRLNIIGKIAI